MVAIVLSVALFFTYVRPMMKDIRAIQDETRDYAQAIERADALRARVNELVAQQNSFSTADLERLEALLPDVRDDVAFMLQVDALADDHNMLFSNIKVTDAEEIAEELKDEQDKGSADIDPAAGTENTGAMAYDISEVSFTVTGTYEEFRRFLADLERSLLLVDVVKLDFKESEGDLVAFNLTVRTYSFKSGI